MIITTLLNIKIIHTQTPEITTIHPLHGFRSVGNLEIDFGMLSDQSKTFVVDNLAKLLRGIRDSHLGKLEFAITELFIMANVIITNFDEQHHLVKTRQSVKGKCFAIDWVQIILLDGRFELAIGLVGSKLFLFHFKLKVRIALACVVNN